MATCKIAHRLTMCFLFGLVILSHTSEGKRNQRVRRSDPVVYDIYTLDYFIELVEKIERNVTDILDVTTHIRKLGYDDDYWTNLVGTALPLPVGILSTKEKDVLTKMIAHRYDGSRELGVVRTSTGETITIADVINGICAGLQRNKTVSLVQWASGATKKVDNLYAATIAGVLGETALNKKNDPSASYFGPGGSWNSNDCPAQYVRPSNDVNSKASNAELLGIVDGFLLGYYLPQWARRGVRLGQLFRMYYSTGICYDPSVASCKRYNKIENLLNAKNLLEQVSGIAEAFYLINTASYPNVKTGDISGIARSTIDEFLPYLEKLQNNQKCPDKKEGCELPANLVFVMDESTSINSDDFNKQKLFVRKIIDAFNISPRQTNVAIVEFSNYANTAIGLHQYGSKTRLKCAVGTMRQSGGWTHTAQAIQLVKDEIFLPAQRQALSKKSDISNIMILLTDGESNDADKGALRKAVNDMKNEVKELTMISVGVGSYKYSELKLIATDPHKHVFTADGFTALLQLVKMLHRRTCTTPVQMDLDFKQDANNTVVTAYVFPGSVRYFTLAPEYFYGVTDINIAVKPLFGSLSIFASRTTDTPGPGNYTYKLDLVPLDQLSNLHIEDVCGGYNQTTCPPVYLAIYAKEANCSCTDADCVIPGQIKFTIEKGYSSTLQVRASFLFVLTSLMLFYII